MSLFTTRFDRLIFGPAWPRTQNREWAAFQREMEDARAKARKRAKQWFKEYGDGSKHIFQDEFDPRLELDGEMMLGMTDTERGQYIRALVRLRDAAHNHNR
jgi:hypothetical protein